MVIALVFFKRIFTRSLAMNQAHGLIIAEVYGTRCVGTNTPFAQSKARRRVCVVARRPREDQEIPKTYALQPGGAG